MPTESWGTRLTTRIARNLPFGNDRVYLSLWLRAYQLPGGASRIVPWLCLFNDELDLAMPVLRLPGAKIVEMWDPDEEVWLQRLASVDEGDES